MSQSVRYAMSTVLAVACLSPAFAQQTLGNLLGNAINASVKKALGGPASTSATSASSTNAQALADATENGSYPIPAFDQRQAGMRRALLSGVRLDYVNYAGLPNVLGGALQAGEVPAAYLEKLKATNHQNSFDERDFLSFAQPYMNWAEAYLMKPEVFVSISDVSAALQPFDMQSNAFPILLGVRDRSTAPTSTNLQVSFGDQGNRELENLRATHGITAVIYLTQTHGDRLPYQFNPLALQLFDSQTGRSLVVTTFTTATTEQKALIQNHALKSLQLAYRTPLVAGTAASSPAEGQNARYQAALQAQAAAITHPGSAVPASPGTSKACTAGEDALRATSLTKAQGATRVDYINVVTHEKSWTNLSADFIRDNHVKVGAVFCLAP